MNNNLFSLIDGETVRFDEYEIVKNKKELYIQPKKGAKAKYITFSKIDKELLLIDIINLTAKINKIQEENSSYIKNRIASIDNRIKKIKDKSSDNSIRRVRRLMIDKEKLLKDLEADDLYIGQLIINFAKQYGLFGLFRKRYSKSFVEDGRLKVVADSSFPYYSGENPPKTINYNEFIEEYMITESKNYPHFDEISTVEFYSMYRESVNDIVNILKNTWMFYSEYISIDSVEKVIDYNKLKEIREYPYIDNFIIFPSVKEGKTEINFRIFCLLDYMLLAMFENINTTIRNCANPNCQKSFIARGDAVYCGEKKCQSFKRSKKMKNKVEEEIINLFNQGYTIYSVKEYLEDSYAVTINKTFSMNRIKGLYEKFKGMNENE